ncbi:MAG: T9SS type A sorting domain-containing protein [Bacteroidetes bacterium]|nr:T9SS type A sorting domain-containing protein [Bacteroidota bacterium]
MMKKLLLITALMATGLWSLAQTDWIQVNSDLDAGRGIAQISVGMNDPTALWASAVNSTGALIDEYTRSTDGGTTWTQGYFNAGTGLSQLFAIDAMTCWAAFNTGATQGCYKTENGGVTWVKKGTAFGGTSFADVIHFFNDNDGCAVGDPIGGYYEIYTTTDRGESWTRVPSANIPPPSSADEYGITGNYDAVGDIIWFGTNKGRVFRSPDKGYTWTAALTAFGATVVVDCKFKDAQNGIAYRSYLDLGIEPVLNVTTDGGTTWTSVTVTGNMYSRWFAYVPGTENTYVSSSSAVNQSGISYTRDGGYAWTTLTAGYPFQAMAWFDDETGLAGTWAYAVPDIAVSPDSFNPVVTQGETATDILNIQNIGNDVLDYTIYVVYEGNQINRSQIGEKSHDRSAGGMYIYTGGPLGTVTLSSNDYPDVTAVIQKTDAETPQSTDDEVILHYDGVNAGGIYFITPPVTAQVAAMFPASMILPYAGMELTSVDIFAFNIDINPNTQYFLRIYDMGDANGPGDLLHIQEFTPVPGVFTTIELTDPVWISGVDLWVAWEFTQTDIELAIPGMDAGPHNPNGDWMYTGAAWYHLSANPDLDRNWNIRAKLTGTPVFNWLQVGINPGTIPPGGENNITITFDASELTEGTYNASLLVASNDPDTPEITVPVTLTVEPSPYDPPTNLEAIVDCYDINLTWQAPGGGGQTEELIYDNNVATNGYQWIGYTMSTHMSPQGPCQLLAVKYYTILEAGDNTFNCNLFEWAGTEPGTDIIYTQLVDGVADDWVTVDLSAQNITFSDDFVVGFGSINATTFIGFDANLNNGRSWDFDETGLTWSPWTEAYLERAIVQYADGSIEELAGSPFEPVQVNAETFTNINRTGSGTSINDVKPIENKSFREDPIGYNIYRDGSQINGDPVTDLFYTDPDLALGTYTYEVTAVYSGGESMPTLPATAEVVFLDPVNDLVVSNEPGSPDVAVTWLQPGGIPQWIHWDDGANYDGIGNTTAATFLVAARFAPENLVDFDDMFLTKIAFFPRGYNTTYTLKVWSGVNAGTELLSQPCPTLVFDEWNEITLTAPVPIDITQELWIGYECIQPAGDYPAGCDAGPAVVGFGDMLFNGTTWVSIFSTYGININWNIQGWVGYTDAAAIPIVPVAAVAITNSSGSIPVLGNMRPADNTVFNPLDRSLTGFNIYRNGDLLNEAPITETFYNDSGLPNGLYEYCVEAVYNGICLSEQVCGEVNITVGIDELANRYVTIYPNPVRGFVNLEFTTAIKSVKMMNNIGQVVYSNENINSNEILRVNTASFEPGIYFVQVQTTDGVITRKLTVH